MTRLMIHASLISTYVQQELTLSNKSAAVGFGLDGSHVSCQVSSRSGLLLRLLFLTFVYGRGAAFRIAHCQARDPRGRHHVRSRGWESPVIRILPYDPASSCPVSLKQTRISLLFDRSCYPAIVLTLETGSFPEIV